MNTSDPRDVGLDPERLAWLTQAVQRDVEAGQYSGAVVCVARRGKTVLHEAIGMSDRSAGRATKVTDVFPIMSLSKSLFAACLLGYFERGVIRLTTPVCEVIPEFAAGGKRRTTIAQVLSHTGGLPPVPPIPQERWGNLEEVVAALCKLPIVAQPAQLVSYSGFAAYSIVGEIIRRLDSRKRALRQIMNDDLFQPLGMTSTSVGQDEKLEARRVPVVMTDTSEGRFTPDFAENLNKILRPGAELPPAGCYGTASDYLRFAQMLARGGELDGKRMLSPLTIRLATSNVTGSLPNPSWAMYRELHGWDEVPASLGLGFYLRGSGGIHPSYFGTLNSSGTFGHPGLGSCMYWVDPEAEMTFVMLSAGVLEESRSMVRFQRLGDIALSSVVDVPILAH